MTIYALSSGPGISGIAVIRISGQETSEVLRSLTQKELPQPRIATLRKINKINTSELIDEGIILLFPGPESYTGEDMAEIQVHGSKAVVDALHSTLSNIENLLLLDIYPASEKKIKGYEGKDLFHALKKNGSNVVFCQNHTEVIEKLENMTADWERRAKFASIVPFHEVPRAA